MDALILRSTYADPTAVMTGEQVQSLADLARTNWPMAAQLLADTTVRSNFPEIGQTVANSYLRSTDGAFVSRFILEQYDTSNVSALLPDVSVPTLLLHALDNSMFPFALAQHIADRIPTSRLVPLEGDLQYVGVGDDHVADLIRSFLAECAPASRGGDRAADERRARCRWCCSPTSSATRR